MSGGMGYEMVRVSTEMVERLIAQEPQPVVLVGIERFEDGTAELFFRTPEGWEAVASANTYRRTG